MERKHIHNGVSVLTFVVLVGAALFNGAYIIGAALAVAGAAMNYFTWRK